MRVVSKGSYNFYLNEIVTNIKEVRVMPNSKKENTFVERIKSVEDKMKSTEFSKYVQDIDTIFTNLKTENETATKAGKKTRGLIAKEISVIATSYTNMSRVARIYAAKNSDLDVAKMAAQFKSSAMKWIAERNDKVAWAKEHADEYKAPEVSKESEKAMLEAYLHQAY